jgi:hypothetical protein
MCGSYDITAIRLIYNYHLRINFHIFTLTAQINKRK